MNKLHLFSHGVTSIVVQILREQDGQATCRVVRCVYPPGRHSPEFWRAQHDQPSPGEEIILPRDMLRPCPFSVRIRATRPTALPARIPIAATVGGILCILGFLFSGTFVPPPHADAVTEQLLQQAEEANAELELRQDFAHKHINKADWKKWSREYYETGRNDTDLVNDINWSGGPIRRTPTANSDW